MFYGINQTIVVFFLFSTIGTILISNSDSFVIISPYRHNTSFRKQQKQRQQQYDSLLPPLLLSSNDDNEEKSSSTKSLAAIVLTLGITANVIAFTLAPTPQPQQATQVPLDFNNKISDKPSIERIVSPSSSSVILPTTDTKAKDLSSKLDNGIITKGSSDVAIIKDDSSSINPSTLSSKSSTSDAVKGNNEASIDKSLKDETVAIKTPSSPPVEPSSETTSLKLDTSVEVEKNIAPSTTSPSPTQTPALANLLSKLDSVKSKFQDTNVKDNEIDNEIQQQQSDGDDVTNLRSVLDAVKEEIESNINSEKNNVATASATLPSSELNLAPSKLNDAKEENIIILPPSPAPPAPSADLLLESEINTVKKDVTQSNNNNAKEESVVSKLDTTSSSTSNKSSPTTTPQSPGTIKGDNDITASSSSPAVSNTPVSSPKSSYLDDIRRKAGVTVVSPTVPNKKAVVVIDENRIEKLSVGKERLNEAIDREENARKTFFQKISSSK